MRNILKVFNSSVLEGTHALVTGGAGGIGRQVTIDLLKLGCNVSITSRKESKLENALNFINERTEKPESLYGTLGNVKSEQDINSIVLSSRDKFGPIDHLVNLAGGQFLSKAEKIPLKAWKAVVDSNLTGSFLMSKAVFLNDMQQRGGNIINVTSADMATGTIPGMSHSSASRAGVENLTKSLALEWAKFGVRVNCIAPGIIFNEMAESNYQLPVFEKFKRSLPLGLGCPEDVSAIICFLCSPAAAFFTGETIRVDGGSSIYTSLWRDSDELFNNL
ncbi:peroxisomal trans-2-enoyl-CoA reductase-like [Convolutriloba macropyga]|uniref:peroxisomal trans-2-enoyl-CoA reductase-like n=1 Tax=Convolutriloba macropyga TaxID=536237 RepID=UPI003F51C5E7